MIKLKFIVKNKLLTYFFFYLMKKNFEIFNKI